MVLLPKRLLRWELEFPEGRTCGVMRIAGYPSSSEDFGPRFAPNELEHIVVNPGETGDAEVVRHFSTRPERGVLRFWYSGAQFGFYENVPQRVSNLNVTHVVVEVGSSNPQRIPRVSDQCFF